MAHTQVENGCRPTGLGSTGARIALAPQKSGSDTDGKAIRWAVVTALQALIWIAEMWPICRFSHYNLRVRLTWLREEILP